MIRAVVDPSTFPDAGSGRFVYVPSPGRPLTFHRRSHDATVRTIVPEMMYTDGGSIPRQAQLFRGFSPWGFAPAYMVHDWIFVARHCLTDGTPTPANIHPALARWVIDMNAEQPRVSMEYLADHGAEFPVIDPRFAMRDYQHGWYTSTDKKIPALIPDSDAVYNSIVHFDVKNHRADSYAFESGYVSEPMFVPRAADAAEGDGGVLSCVYDFKTKTSALHIFNALDIAAGPIGKAQVSHRVPVCFHGTWRQAV